MKHIITSRENDDGSYVLRAPDGSDTYHSNRGSLKAECQKFRYLSDLHLQMYDKLGKLVSEFVPIGERDWKRTFNAVRNPL